MCTESHRTQAPQSTPIVAEAMEQAHEPVRNERVGSTEEDLRKAQGHWILARMGKKVLRPGGLALTKRMLNALHVQTVDDVAEFAPGVGYTACLTLANNPYSFTGIDGDAKVVSRLTAKLGGAKCQFIQGNAACTGLAAASMDKVYGEAILTMHADHRKREIIREAFRILRPGGSYGIHELGLTPDTITSGLKAQIQRDLSEVIHVNPRPLTETEWQHLLEEEGFVIVSIDTSPMRLLEPGRMIADEGILRTLRIVYNIIRNSIARQRVLAMRHVFRSYRYSMNAIAIVAVKA